jgi:hypothetical protein
MDQAKNTIERIEALSRGGRKLTPKEVEERLQNYSVMRRNELVLKDRFGVDLPPKVVQFGERYYCYF